MGCLRFSALVPDRPADDPWSWTRFPVSLPSHACTRPRGRTFWFKAGSLLQHHLSHSPRSCIVLFLSLPLSLSHFSPPHHQECLLNTVGDRIRIVFYKLSLHLNTDPESSAGGRHLQSTRYTINQQGGTGSGKIQESHTHHNKHIQTTTNNHTTSVRHVELIRAAS